MPYLTKLQLIQRKTSQQFYVNFPAALAQALDFERGEQLEWILLDRSQLVLNRRHTPPVELKKKLPNGSSTTSKRSSAKRSRSRPAASAE
jgi:hypothetical protein